MDGYGEDSYDEDSYDDDGYGAPAWRTERRWRPAAAFIGCVVALGAIATAVVINSGDSASTKATVGAPVPRTAIAQTTQAPAVSAPKSAKPQLPPETVSTVAPPSAAPSPTALAPAATLDPRTVVYSVTGTKQLLDLVSVVYTDARGYPQTEFNVALPWSKVIVLNPGVEPVGGRDQHPRPSQLLGLQLRRSNRCRRGQQREHRDLHPLARDPVRASVGRESAQTVKEGTELAQTTGARYHQVDELIMVGQQVLGLGDRFAE